MYKKVQSFLGHSYPPESLLAFAQRFLKERESEVTTASVVHLYRTLYQHGLEIDNPPLIEITPRMLAGYVDDLQTRYSPGTIRPVVGDLKQFYGWAYEAGLTEGDYSRRLKRPKKVKEKHHADEGDMMALIKSLSDRLAPLLFHDLFGCLQAANEGWDYESYKTLHDLTSVSFLYETGCRAGELCNLSAHHLSKAIMTPKRRVYGVTCYGKTNDRSYRFTSVTAELCRLWLQERPFTTTWAFVSWRRGYNPAKLTTNALSQMLARRCRQANIKPFRAHSIRHAKVIRSRKAVGLELTSRLIDHSNIQTTKEYDYIEDDELDAAAAITGLSGMLW